MYWTMKQQLVHHAITGRVLIIIITLSQVGSIIIITLSQVGSIIIITLSQVCPIIIITLSQVGS